MKKILGIDPALSTTGIAIIERSYTDELIYFDEIKTKPNTKRFKYIFNAIIEVINNYKPNICIIERSYVNSNPFTSLLLGSVRGVILAACEINDIDYIEMPPTKIRSIIFNTIKIEKKNSIDYVLANFNNKDLNLKITHNIADAIITALAYQDIYND